MGFRYHTRSGFPDILSAPLHGAFHDPPLNNYDLPRADFWPLSGSYQAFEYLHGYRDEEDASGWYHSRAQHSPNYDAWSQTSYEPFRGSQQRGGRLFDQSLWDHPSWAGNTSAAYPLYDPLPQDFDRREQKNPCCSSFNPSCQDSFTARYHGGRPDPWSSFDKHRHSAPFEGNEGRGRDPGYDDQKSPTYTVEEPGGRNSHAPKGVSNRWKTRRRYRTRSEHRPKSSDWGPLNKDGRARRPSPGFCWSSSVSSSQSAPASPNPCPSHITKRRSSPEPDEELPSPVPKRQPACEPYSEKLANQMGWDGNLHKIFRMQQKLKREKEGLDEFRARLERKAKELETRESKVKEWEVRFQGWEHGFFRY